MIVMDILNSRDTVSLPILLKIQHVLGVEVITAKKLQDALWALLAVCHDDVSGRLEMIAVGSHTDIKQLIMALQK